MVVRWTVLCTLLLATFALPEKRTYDTHSYYVLRHNPSLSFSASLADVVSALDVELVEQLGELPDHWVLKRRIPPADLAARDDSDPVLSRFEALKARAASPLTQRSDSLDIARRVVSSIDYLSLQTLRQRIKRAPPALPPPHDSLSKITANRLGIRDPLFPKQWHLINDEFPQFMMNVTGVWEMGFTGKGIITSFLDDGLDYSSEDLSANFDPEDSYDFNTHQELPTPSNVDDHHGTRCAGQVAALKNNVCGIGLAYESRVAGVRMLSGPITDIDEAAALNYGYHNVSIYSCSWGPPDNGQSMEGPNYLIKKAIVNGITNGRRGKGSIFVFASGNGAFRRDQCNFDGYTNSIYSVTVSAVDFRGLHPYYSESCAANMIVAYSSGSGQHIVTTDKGKNSCATTHGGTSAAAPNAAGVFALALEARPDLTWRDIQYLCVETASIINPDDPDWEKTATGRKYSYKYGYGVIDAYKYVVASQSWKLVKPQAWYQSQTVQLKNGTFGADEKYSGGEPIPSGGIESKIEITRQELDEHNFEALEHITIRVWIAHSVRGDVEVEIVSPNSIKSILGGARSADLTDKGYPGWTFMSVKHWGENPVGTWIIKVKDQSRAGANGTFLGWNMALWGSTIDPAKAKNYEVPVIENRLPPIHPTESIPIPSPTASTKQHTKPTAHLPGDHGVASGENTKPAFATNTGTEATPTASPPVVSGTPDVGWFSDLGKLVKNQKWFFGALGAVSLFGISAGIFFWRRRSKRLANYTSLNNEEDVGLSALGTSMSEPRTTRELYDAFGEVSDDDDDDETTALRQSMTRQAGFDPSATPAYHDEPDDSEEARRHLRDREQSISPEGSGDGSWDHASRD